MDRMCDLRPAADSVFSDALIGHSRWSKRVEEEESQRRATRAAGGYKSTFDTPLFRQCTQRWFLLLYIYIYIFQ